MEILAAAFFLLGIMLVLFAVCIGACGLEGASRGLRSGYLLLLFPPPIMMYAWMAFYASATIYFELVH